MGIHGDYKHFVVFSTLYGTHRCKRCPQGHKNSSSYFQMLMEQIFADLPRYVVNYPDDLLCFSKTYGRDFPQTTQQQPGNQHKKSEFLKTETEFLGFKLSLDGIKPTEKHIESVVNFEKPDTMTQLRSFLG